ncbi:MAG: hypothetical protein FWD16_07145 [Clostridia bacterium]|nr:hypothetical protein [Clostridia bacterium]
MKMIYLQNNVFHSIIEPVPGWTLEQCFPPDFLAQCVPWQEGAKQGWIYDPETGFFSEPPPFIPPEPGPEPEPDELRVALEFLSGVRDNEL